MAMKKNTGPLEALWRQALPRERHAKTDCLLGILKDTITAAGRHATRIIELCSATIRVNGRVWFKAVRVIRRLWQALQQVGGSPVEHHTDCLSAQNV